MSKIKVGIQPGIAVAISFALSCSSFSRPVNANPAILAPAAFCAGTAGVGCILIGAVAIAGATYYVWEYSGGKRVVADAVGNVFRSDDYLEDPEQEDQGSVYPLNAKSWQAAQRECAYLMGYSKKFRVFLKKGVWYCTDKGV
ncbi:hypothetical protein Nos7524_2695 [Nostoc sp. PCC 7524]|uniref:hypothetical protein n=1 Tax=Nostoc sp. (strain ATCC 29411 / PCC 7524) TaxID=28072 RepID=UPI00029EC480|nr:hypothetical protein [Nostoc sp. PCC 7524]AFY48528.1 hypothetical protein Nos7524_2695 [Nostoc sp. PCC 7524]